MNVGLIDVDGHGFPNLALMKLSAYHKRRGDSVEWWNGLIHYDLVYQAKVFDETYSKDNDFVVMADKVIKGGTGYDLQNKLPDEVEHIMPDYGLYGITDTAYGFLTRGCPRGCPFCIVKPKEGGRSVKVADLSEWWDGQKNIVLMDSNMTACKDADELFRQLADSGAKVEFNQGIDARLITKKQCEILNRTKLERVHFAWDNYEFNTFDKLKQVREWLKLGQRRMIVYVLTNYNTTHAEDLERVMLLREIGYDPFVMVYDKPHAPKVTRHLQRWCNNKYIFWATENFNEYWRRKDEQD